jgi:glycogen debranching enzyme
MSEQIRIGDQWYVAATSARADESPQVIKSGDTFALFDRFGDIATWGSGEQGLYHEDTRFLSSLELRINGVRPLFLGSTVKEDANLLIVELMNPDLMVGDRVVLAKGLIHVFRAKLLWEGACYEHLRLSNHGLEPVELRIALRLAADFTDLFEVRGAVRAETGRCLPAVTQGGERSFAYDGLDGRRRTSRMSLDPPPNAWDERGAVYELALQPGEERHLYCTVGCEIEGRPTAERCDYDTAYRRNLLARSRQEQARCRIETSHPLMNLWLDRSASDLAMLTTELATGPYPYAGVPWYATTFGRDGLITAREVLWAQPALARGVLAFLASTQARAEDPRRDAEPGKILHEARLCEMARTGEVPFERYYGTVDATPLFVALAGAYWRRTGDLGFVRGLWPNVLAALEWIDRHADADGDGFVDYARKSESGLLQQGWKDSHDSVFHADGRLAQAPIALCEVQAYVYEARLAAAGLARALDDGERAARLERQAAALRSRFQSQFWCEEIGCYAIALDGARQPCRVATSNAGHALWTGIASPEHAARMAERFVESDFFSGWGIRTVASGQARYNPMSYHNGSVWPHDNALLAAGLARYGHTDAALKVFRALYDSSVHFAQHRLPELFCGFERRPGEGPTLYPVACSPQAWAAAAATSLLQSCLGLQVDAIERVVSFHAPRLPEFIDWMRVTGLRVGAASVDLKLQRYTRCVGVEVTRNDGGVIVRIDV